MSGDPAQQGGVKARISKVEPNWTCETFSGGNCKGRGSTHGSSHGITAGGTRQPGRVDRRSRGLVHLKAKRK
jgi:hypothetical protein